MAFNFLSGYPQYGKTAYDPADDSIYNDPRRMGSVGSFNPYALSNFASMQKGGMTPPTDNKPAPPPTPPGAPQVPPVGGNPGTNPPGAGNPSSSTYYVNPGTPPPLNYSNPGGPDGTPVGKNPATGGGTPGAGTGGINYGQYRSIADAYAAFPGGLPPGWNWDAWAAATGNQDALRRTTSGDYNTFTWNPGGGGYINPMTGETFDRLGETIRR